MVKKNKRKRLKFQDNNTKLFDNFFLALLGFILVLEIFALSPATGRIIEKIPIAYLSLFYLVVFMFPLWILFSYYYNVIQKNKTKCATRILALALVRGVSYFIIFIALLSLIILETREISALLLSEVFVQTAVFVGLLIVIFSFLVKLYLCKFSKLKCEGEKL